MATETVTTSCMQTRGYDVVVIYIY